MSSLSELTRIVLPPASPFAARGDWAAAESSVGVSLPDDYKQVVTAYGTGWFFGFLWVSSPFDPSESWSLAYQARVAADNLRTYRAEGFAVPFPVHPEPGGLLNFGSTENGNLLNWVTAGAPDMWGLAIWDPDYLAARPFPDLTLSSLLCELARGRSPATPGGELFPADVLLIPAFVPVHHGE